MGVFLQRAGLLGSAAAAAFTPADLFAASEAGAWYDISDTSTLWQDTAGTVAVTADGQSVARVDDKSGNGNNWTQATAGLRPVYKTNGTLHWLLFDGVDDVLNGYTVGSETNEASVIFDPQAVDFVMKWASGAVYYGIGQSGSSSTTLGGDESTPRVEYWDNVLSTATTRGDNYTLGQASNLWLGRTAGYSTDRIVKIGALSGSFPGPKVVYGALYRVGQMTDEQRSDWSEWALAKAGV